MKLLGPPRPYRGVFYAFLGIVVLGSVGRVSLIAGIAVAIGVLVLARVVAVPALRQWVSLGLWLDGNEVVIGNRDGLFRVERQGMRVTALVRRESGRETVESLDPTLATWGRCLRVHPRGDFDPLNADAVGSMSARRFRSTIASLELALGIDIATEG